MTGGLHPPAVQVGNVSPPLGEYWAENGLGWGFSICCDGLKNKFTRGSELLTVPEALDVVKAGIVTLLMTDVAARKLVGVGGVAMEEALRASGSDAEFWRGGRSRYETYCCRRRTGQG